MLVLSRKTQEQIVVDGRIFVTVLEVRGNRVRLGIEAPPEIPVHRSEVHEAVAHSAAVMENPVAAASALIPTQ